MSNAAAFEEAFNLLCDEKIGSGMSRDVFTSVLLPDCVIKVETRPQHFQNIIEWETWQKVKDTTSSRWFAECRWISPNGRVLVQERTRPTAPRDYPAKVPIWFTDLKRRNWGMVESRLERGSKNKLTCFMVCHDYGTALMLQDGTVTKRMKVAEWNDND